MKVVVVSPGDVAAERDALRGVIDELNRDESPSRDCLLSLWRWETHARPGLHLGGPQGLIDHEMDIHDADVVIGIFWKRFGTPTNEADSGTEHELRRAYAAWKEQGHPDVMVYFCDRAHTPRTLDEVEQWKRVLTFREARLPEQLHWQYLEVSDFERQVRGHLTNVLTGITAGPEEKGRAGSHRWTRISCRKSQRASHSPTRQSRSSEKPSVRMPHTSPILR